MAQFYYDFSDWPVGVGNAPGKITPTHTGTTSNYEIVSDASYTGGAYLKLTTNGTFGRVWFELDEVGTNQDTEVVTRFYVPTNPNNINVKPNSYRHGARLQSASSSPAYFTAVGSSSNQLKIRTYEPTNDLLATGNDVYSADAYFWQRVSVQGVNPTEIKVNVWQGSLTDEPAGWQYSVTDSQSSLQTSGRIAFGFFDYDSQIDQFYDIVSVGTGGDPAPTGPVSTGGGTSVTDTAAITASTSALLGASATATAADTGSIIGTITMPLTGVVTGSALDQAVIAKVIASVLSAADTGAATDAPTVTTAQATVSNAVEQSVANDSAAIARAQMQASIASSQAIANDAAGIIVASSTSLLGLSGNNIVDVAQLVHAGTATMEAQATTEAIDAAQVAGASVQITTSAEIAASLDNAIIVNAQGLPIASMELSAVIDTASVAMVTATPLVALFDSQGMTVALYGEPNIVPVLSGGYSVISRLRGRVTIH